MKKKSMRVEKQRKIFHKTDKYIILSMYNQLNLLRAIYLVILY